MIKIQQSCHPHTPIPAIQLNHCYCNFPSSIYPEGNGLQTNNLLQDIEQVSGYTLITVPTSDDLLHQLVQSAEVEVVLGVSSLVRIVALQSLDS